MTKLSKPRYQVDPPTNDKGGHVYKVVSGEIEKFRGITTFLSVIAKPALVPWAKKEALESVRKALLENTLSIEEFGEKEMIAWIDGIIKKASEKPKAISDHAIEAGTRLHTAIEVWIKSQIAELPDVIAFAPKDQISPLFDNFHNWQSKEKIKWIGAEIPCASLKHGYGTTIDGLGIQNGKLCLFEWKTSADIYKEYFLQTAAEVFALEATYGVDIDAAFIVRFGKDGKFNPKKDVQKLNNPEKAFELFLHAKSLWEGLNE